MRVVDNVTHAFVGAAMGECAWPAGTASRTRAAFICVGIVAANAPDVDLLYTSITEEPLGYLLHHRGHSHTLPGLAALGLMICSGLLLLPSTRLAVLGAGRRWILLITAALLSHVLMDTANGYGTHLFYPFSSRWVYGDAVFVLEPWLWAILGATLALNAARLWRVVVVLLGLILIGALVFVGLLPAGMGTVVVLAAGVGAFLVRGWDRQRRAVTALLATAAIFLVMAGVSRVAKSETRRALAKWDGGELVDLVSDANPGTPWCWAVLTLQRATEGTGETLVARRGTLSLLPGVWPATSCASARLSSRWPSDLVPTDTIVWHRQWTIDVEELLALSAANCRVRAWLQFGRVPYVANGRIADLRFENPIGQNFTPMAIDAGSRGCPARLTNWQFPRRDILTPSSTD